MTVKDGTTATFRDRFASRAGIRSRELIAEGQDRIIEAAIPLFYEHGFHKTTVRMVANGAGMSMGNLYQYIKTKDDILVLVAVKIMENLDEVMAKTPSEGKCREHQLLELLAGYIDVIDQNRRATKLLYRESASLSPEVLPDVLDNLADHARHRFAQLIQQGIDEGDVLACEPEVIAVNLLMFAHAWALKGWALKRVVDLESFRSEQLRNASRMIPFVRPAGGHCC